MFMHPSFRRISIAWRSARPGIPLSPFGALSRGVQYRRRSGAAAATAAGHPLAYCAVNARMLAMLLREASLCFQR
ncbi:hypothetical protein CE91St32_04820 [Gordonibacter pamelaeae]|nr:hypothetical protein CE91St32_04820 [Gordonibacter pamelaeae]